MGSRPHLSTAALLVCLLRLTGPAVAQDAETASLLARIKAVGKEGRIGQRASLSAGTDGIDGNSPAAGAVADGESLARARAKGLDPVGFQKRSDAFNFFSVLDDAIITGPTGNNLRDLRILIAH